MTYMYIHVTLNVCNQGLRIIWVEIGAGSVVVVSRYQDNISKILVRTNLLTGLSNIGYFPYFQMCNFKYDTLLPIAFRDYRSSKSGVVAALVDNWM